jgi:hypothetical protein
MHMPVMALHSPALSQMVPMFSKPVRSILHRSGCAPLQRICPGSQARAMHVPLLAPERMQSAGESHAVTLSQPLRVALQSWGWPLLSQRRSPAAHVGAMQFPLAHSVALTQSVPSFTQPLRPELHF